MLYVGGKSRIVEPISQIIIGSARDLDQTYVEPFMGGGSVISQMPFKRRIGNDINKYLIALFSHMQEGGALPEPVSKEEYLYVREQVKSGEAASKYPDWFVGYCAFMCSYRAIYFGGYCGYSYQDKAVKSLCREFNRKRISSGDGYETHGGLQDVELHAGEYDALEIPHDSLVYCDIPYFGVYSYKTSSKFDHPKFWDWARRQVTENGSTVFVREYTAPGDWTCVWQQQLKVQLNYQVADQDTTKIERLFTYYG